MKTDNTKMMRVSAKAVIGTVRGTDDSKIKYTVVEDAPGNSGRQRKFIVVTWPKIASEPIVFDEEFDDLISEFNWSVYQYPMITHHVNSKYHTYQYMHQMIITAIDPAILSIKGNTVDHINGYKRDNRRENLRVVTMSVQNANRPSRSDKKPPHPDLIALGIAELPRHVRWDNTETKFVIENHPTLINRVEKGIIKRPSVSGTKSVSCTVVQKYQDIIARLDELDREWTQTKPETIDMKEKKRSLTREYIDIVNSLLMAEGKPLLEHSRTDKNDGQIALERRTMPNRKQPDRFPPDCGVTSDMMPPGTYYCPEKENKGDKFTIDIHPVTKKRVSLSSTGSQQVFTMDKYEQMMEIYERLLRETVT